MDRQQIAEGLLLHLSEVLAETDGAPLPIAEQDGQLIDNSAGGEFLKKAVPFVNAAIDMSQGKPSGLTRPQAEQLAKGIKNTGLESLAREAAQGITNWKEPCRLNAGITKGKFWNLYVPGMDFEKRISESIKINFLIEFGHLLPHEIIPPIKKAKGGRPIHQEPKLGRFKEEAAEIGPENLNEENE